jgi:phenylacetate-coenzyme A ligase PaaK-like adenylate-forming protein
MIHDIEYETMPREALEAIQLRRLQSTLARVYSSVPFYKKAFEEAGIVPSDIKTLSDLKLVPFTTKQDLRDNYPLWDICLSHGSSGAHSCILRHNRKTDGRGVYGKRYQNLGRT